MEENILVERATLVTRDLARAKAAGTRLLYSRLTLSFVFVLKSRVERIVNQNNHKSECANSKPI